MPGAQHHVVHPVPLLYRAPLVENAQRFHRVALQDRRQVVAAIAWHIARAISAVVFDTFEQGTNIPEGHQAADELVAGGERPTVERIRAHLGTGSPNTVTRHLDTWWSSVGARLRQRAIEQDRPGVPAAVDALAQRCWRAALDAAGEQAQAALANERTALEGTQAAWEAQSLAQAQGWAQRQQRLDEAEQQSRTYEATAAALREQLQQLSEHAADLQHQRDGAFARNERLDQQLVALNTRLEAQGRQHEQERGELHAHVRATENHALGEIDRARQALQQQKRTAAAAHAQLTRDRAAAEAARHQAEAVAVAAQREAQVQTALASGCAAQLAALGDLVMQLRAALNKARPAAATRRRRAPSSTP